MAGTLLSSSRAKAVRSPGRQPIPVTVEPSTPFVEGPGPGRDWWEKMLSEKRFSSQKRGKGQHNQRVGAKSRTTHLGPFGELIRCSGPMAKLNPFRFSTKYDDGETDFLYYGYGYYNPFTGRWLSMDPKDEEGLKVLNFGNENFEDDGYLPDGSEMNFVGNDPIGETDVLGLWLSSSAFWKEILMGGRIITAHQNAVYRAIPGLSSGDYATIIAAVVAVDDAQNQGTDPASTAKHAMSSTGESPAAARAMANAWVRQHMEAVREAFCECGSHMNETDGLYEFGLALHTVQDSTSPAHWGFQTWLGSVGYGATPAMIHHVHEENFDQGAGSQLYTATGDLYKLLDYNTPFASRVLSLSGGSTRSQRTLA